jgi:hypothetical protein
MNRASPMALTVCSLAIVGGAITAAVLPRSDPARGTAPPCTVAAVGRAAGTAASQFARVRCTGRWALAAGADAATGDIGIFLAYHGRWASDGGFAPARLLTVSPAQFANAGIDPHLLLRLSRSFPPVISQLAGAGALVEELSARETRLNAAGLYEASQVLRAPGGPWFVLAGANAPIGDGSSVTASPYPDGTLEVYRWSDVGWREQGVVRGWMGPISECCGITAAFLTGSRDPDFAVSGGGAADTNWFAIVSDTGGRWHLVPFDYGYAESTVVNGGPQRGGVWTEVDATSAAQGPTTRLFETYRDGAFRPASPPGPQAPCAAPGLERAADAGRKNTVEFTGYSCADGWAIAVGTRAGHPGRAVGLFDANAAKWHVVELDSGASLGCDPGIYDIPLSLLSRLATRLGPALDPELAVASLVATKAMTGWPYVAGVVAAGRALWFIAEKPTPNAQDPGATARVYRWSGSAWLRLGIVNQVPASLNYYDRSGLYVAFGQFEAVTVTGADDPGFLLTGTGLSHPDVFTDAGGRWHAAPYRH